MKLENLYSSTKDLQFNLYQLKKATISNKQKTTATTTKQKKNEKQKKLFNKHRFDVIILSKVKPIHWIYVLHNLQGHSPVSHFLILDLNIRKDLLALCSH